MKLLASLVFAFALQGCVSLNYHDHPPDVQPIQDKALIYFIEGRDLFPGSGYEVRDGDATVGGLEAGVYFYVFIEPGDHLFSLISTRGASLTSMRRNYVAGHSYYYFYAPWVFIPSEFQEITESTGKDMIKKLRYATLK